MAHEEEKTQNKYKLMLRIDKYYQRKKTTREIIYIDTHKQEKIKIKILGGSQCYPFTHLDRDVSVTRGERTALH